MDKLYKLTKSNQIELKGTKKVEVPYFSNQMLNNSKSVLIVGEHFGGIEGVSETVKELGFTDVTTTDIMAQRKGSWLNTKTDWKHIQCDFIEFDESNKYDFIISISVFEHFGFWFAGDRMANGLAKDDLCRWNHDLIGIIKACKLLKDDQSKLIITLPAGPYMNYEETGEPFLRYYDRLRQQLIRNTVEAEGYFVTNEKYYYSNDVENWQEVGVEINDPKYYSHYNPFTPNVIWGLTIQKKI